MRGGFLVTDDMWGDDAWDVFRETMQRVLPGRDIPDLAESDPVMHVLYDIRDKDRTFIPGSRHLWRRGDSVQVVQPAGSSPAWRGMYDDHNHMIVSVNYDTDIGDAWEFADVPYYPEAMTALAYRYGINYIIYAMTHRRAVLSGSHDGTGVPLRHQLHRLRDDALTWAGQRFHGIVF